MRIMKKKLTKAERKAKFELIFTDYFLIALGSAIYAFGVDYFIAPNEIATGGATGIATMLNYLTGFPIGTAVLIINIPLFVAAYKNFGARFITKTIIATTIASVLMDAYNLFIPVYHGNRLLAALFGGALIGFGLGLVFLRGGTTGGSDILSKLIRLKKPQYSLGTTIFFCDAAVVAATFFVYRSIESLLYSSIVFFVSAKAVDELMFGASRSKMLLIITDRSDRIAEKILHEAHHGVTTMNVTGGYSGHEKRLLISVVRPNEAAKITRVVKQSDPDAFTIITDAAEVMGRGFGGPV